MIKDGEGTVLQRFNYYPFGSESRVWTAGTNTPQSALRYRFGGKEIAGQKVSVSTGIAAAAAGSPYLDFGARVYDPRTAAWLSQDPLSEKYYSISPYAYCAGNPVNLVDLDGMDWYSYFEKGEKKYVFNEGPLSDEEIYEKQYNYEGLTVLTDDNYYSLFGSTIPNTKDNSLIISLFSNIDELLKRYAHVLTYSSSNPLNQEEPSTKTDFSTSRVSRPFSFEYTGAMFSSTKDGTIIHPISSASLNGKTITGDPFLVIDNFVTQGQINNGGIGIGLYGKQWKNSYWITARSNSVRSTPLQIRFDYTNAQGFIHSFNSIFGTDIKLPE